MLVNQSRPLDVALVCCLFLAKPIMMFFPDSYSRAATSIREPPLPFPLFQQQCRHPFRIATQIISAGRPSCSLVPSDRAIAGQSSPSKCWSAWSSKGGEQEELDMKKGSIRSVPKFMPFPSTNNINGSCSSISHRNP